MFVLGIDPGLSRCGYAVIEPGPRGGGRPIAIGVIRTDPERATATRLVEIRDELRSLLVEFEPGVVSVERIFVHNNVRTAVSVAQVSGLVMAEAAAGGADVAEYTPSQVKAAVAGDGRADKQQVQDMVKTLLGLSAAPRPADAADAAALALCHLAHDPTGRMRSTAGGARR